MRFALFLAGILTLPMQLLLGDFTQTFKVTAGPNNYSAVDTSFVLGLPVNFYFGADYNSYYSSGRYQTYTGFTGLSLPQGSLNVTGSLTPQVNSYQNQTVSVDGSCRVLNAGESQEESLKPYQVYLNAGYGLMKNIDGSGQFVDFSEPTNLQFPNQSNYITQEDYSGGLEVRIFETQLTGKFIKSNYNQSTFRTTTTRILIQLPVPQQGYLDQSAQFSLNQKIRDWAGIYGSYSNDHYKFGQDGIADTYTFGTRIWWKFLELNLEFSRYIPSNGDSANYYSSAFTYLFSGK